MTVSVPIPRPETAFIDPKNGSISREWYLFLVRPYFSENGIQTLSDVEILEAIDDAYDLSDLVPGVSDKTDSVERLAWTDDDAISDAEKATQEALLQQDEVITPTSDELLANLELEPINQVDIDVIEAMELEPLPVVSRGTFTPTLVSTGGGVPTYTMQQARFTKIDNRVLFELQVALATLGTLAAGNVTINGLPYVSEATANNRQPVAISAATLGATAATMVMAHINSGTSQISLFRYAAGVRTNLAVADLSGTDNISISGQYEVNTP